MDPEKANHFSNNLNMAQRQPVGIWLLTTAAFVFAMAVIGAITRLTESGLSMVEWRPLIGTLPPLSEAEWLRVFELYQTSPEYVHKNAGMSLDDFKYIFFWEWFHRLWGRLIGLVYALPFFYFLFKGRFNGPWKFKLGFLLILGGLQGLMGWYMVMSGLIDEPAVSHYRLAAHLSLAFILFGLLLYFAFDWLAIKSNITLNFEPYHLKGAYTGLFLIALTIIWGAFVAGKDAGLIYNSFPKMGPHWVPPEIDFLNPFWRNIFENHVTIQFVHRILAMITVVYLLIWSFHYLQTSYLFKCLAAMALIQMSLGIATVISVVWIPLAAMHQAGALILVGLMIAITHQIYQNKLRTL